MGLQAAEPALHVPEFFKADICGKPAFSNMIIKHFKADAVGNNGGLSHSNIGKGTRMHHARLIFSSAHEGGVNGVAHPGAHGAAHLKVTGGHWLTALVKCYGNLIEALTQVCQVFNNGKNGHTLRPHGNTEF